MVMKLERRRQVVVLSDEEWLAEHRRAGSKRSRTDLLRQKMKHKRRIGIQPSAQSRTHSRHRITNVLPE